MAVRRLFVAEGLILAAAGSALGLLGAVGYTALVLHGLRTWWNSAVNFTSLSRLAIWRTPSSALCTRARHCVRYVFAGRRSP